MPNKPIKEGFKFFVAVDYDSGVCFDINMADGNPIDLTDDTEACTTGHYIMELLKTLPGEGYKGYCDNFYSSPALFVEAKLKHNVYLVGTLRSDRGVHPGVVLQSKKPTNKCPKGTVRYSHNLDRSLHMYGLMDSTACYILDAAYGSLIEDNLVLRRKNKDGTFMSFHVPPAIVRYNQYMGGVDLWDMVRTGWYGLEMTRRCSRWILRFFEVLISMATANAFMIFCHINKLEKKNLAHYDFTMTLVEGLLEKEQVYASPATRGEKRKALELDESDLHRFVQTEPGTAEKSAQARTMQVPQVNF
jgi:hypothetical protein